MFLDTGTPFLVEGALQELIETSKFFREGYRKQHDADKHATLARDREQAIRLAMVALESRIDELTLENKILAVATQEAEFTKVIAERDSRKWGILYRWEKRKVARIPKGDSL
jgi:hypothetical protein